VKISNAGDVIYVRLEGECAVEDDTQALDLGERKPGVLLIGIEKL
jgi:hypothetical protein